MTLEEKISNRCNVVYRRRGIKPVGLVVDENTYGILCSRSSWNYNFVGVNFGYGPGYDTYAGLMLSVIRAKEEIITVY